MMQQDEKQIIRDGRCVTRDEAIAIGRAGSPTMSDGERWYENPGCNCGGRRLSWLERLGVMLRVQSAMTPICGGHSRPHGYGLSKIDMDRSIDVILEHYDAQ